jgi:superoxide reductase
VSKEKHIPVWESVPAGILVKVGSIEHPMEEQHYIEWIELKTTGGLTERRTLKPGSKPEALFDAEAAQVAELAAYCNIHGLWNNKVK